MRTSATWCLAFALLCGGCEQPASAPPRPALRFAASDPFFGGPLAEEFARRLTHFDIQMVSTPGSVAVVDALQRRAVDLGIVSAADVYFAARDAHASVVSELRAISLTYVVPIYLIVRPGLSARDLRELRENTFSSGPRTTATWYVAELLLQAFGIDPQKRLVEGTSSDGLLEGTIDAWIATGIPPAEAVSNAVRHGARLVPIEGGRIDDLRGRNPFIRAMSIPAGTYPGQGESLRTVGVDTVLVCRADLEPALVYQLARTMSEALRVVLSSLPEQTLIDPDAAAATPIPLHDGAAMYFREAELAR